MKKKVLALLVPALLAAGTAQAAEIYKDDTNSINMMGWLGFAALNDGSDTAVVDNFSRIGFRFDRQEKNGWRSFAHTEWGINMVTSDDSLTYEGGQLGAEKSSDFLFNRLGYVGLAHDKWGSLTFGKQWGAYYDVAYTTDVLNVFTGYSVGAYTFGDGGLTGAGRADSSFIYRNSFGGLDIALQYAAKQNGDVALFDKEGMALDDGSNISFDTSYGASLTYHFTDKFKVLAGFNRGDFEGSLAGVEVDDTNEIIGVGAQYGSFYQYAPNREADGLYVGVNAHQSKQNELVAGQLYDSTGAEFLVAYQYENGFVPSFLLSYQDLDTDESTAIKGQWTRQFAVLGLHYRYSNDTVMFAEAKLDFSEMDDKSFEALQDNSYAIGIRYFF
ncbi:porin [Shewanella eurypsychrophilus]|uniref:Porin n=1 Tax=Shewanella eurypsychrophilus TaxID=2593656 RepID=A0ABX6V488_9GAMM|nr:MULTISPECIES: porin [Shewanella]QFU22178.1 porin [Shewanella sp. YLB-09]QPG57465.1 porin [Shewanella eurypsychrophilus]